MKFVVSATAEQRARARRGTRKLGRVAVAVDPAYYEKKPKLPGERPRVVKDKRLQLDGSPAERHIRQIATGGAV